MCSACQTSWQYCRRSHMAADGPGSTWAMRTASSGVTGPSPFITRVTAAGVTSRCLANCLALSPRCSSVSARIVPGCGGSYMPLIKISSMFCPTGFSQQQTAPVKAPKKDVSISKGQLARKPLPSPFLRQYSCRMAASASGSFGPAMRRTPARIAPDGRRVHSEFRSLRSNHQNL